MLLDLVYFVVAVGILWKCADLFVDGAVGIAEWLQVPSMFVGLVIVSVATTSPELMASAMAAFQGHPELALGNAVGSVSLDASMALGIAAVLSVTPLTTEPSVFRSSAAMLIAVFALAWYMASDGTLTRLEGGLLVIGYIVNTVLLFRKLRIGSKEAVAEASSELADIHAEIEGLSRRQILIYFGIGLLGVIGGSHLLLEGALGLAEGFGISPVITGLVIVAIGTSTPEIATAVASGLKGKSGIGVGNVIGADILNICWVAGFSAVINPLTARPAEVQIMFPAVFVIVLIMLGTLWFRGEVNRRSGMMLIGLYVAYLCVLLAFAPSAATGEAP